MTLEEFSKLPYEDAKAFGKKCKRAQRKWAKEQGGFFTGLQQESFMVEWLAKQPLPKEQHSPSPHS